VVAHTLERVEAVELKPFRAAIRANVAAIMTAHIRINALDDERPATLSRAILTDLLRKQMGFDGLIVTDAMDMYAVARYGMVESVRAALEAGNDFVMLAHLPDHLALIPQTIDLLSPESLKRIRAVQARLTHDLPPLDVVGCREHHNIAQAIADQSITLVRDSGRLPLRLNADAEIVVITAAPEDLTPADTSSQVKIALADAIRSRHSRVTALELPHHAADADIRAVLVASESADAVIVGTIAADHDAGQAEVVRQLHARVQRPIVVALRTPYDLTAFPMIDTYLCAYSIRAVTTEAVARVLFGEMEAHGVLPCAIPGAVV
jgi:beta-N-acetylhexosaminidase